jgi:hypothetical protein
MCGGSRQLSPRLQNRHGRGKKLQKVDIHDETQAARCSHPSARPHDLHILSTTRIFSSLSSPGSSKSPTSSKKPSLSRLLGGSHVSAYCRSDDTESSSKPAVRCGIAPFRPKLSPRACGCVMRRRSMRRMASHAAVRRRVPPKCPYLDAPAKSPRKYPPAMYTREQAGATPTKANVSSWDFSSLSIPASAWSTST